MTLRRRLTLLFAALVGGMGLVSSLALMAGLSLTLNAIAQEEVRAKAQQVEDYLRELQARERRPLDFRGPEALPRAFSDDGMLLQLSDGAGQVWNRSANLAPDELPPSSEAGLKPRTLRAGDPNSHVLVATRRLSLGPSVVWIQAAMPLRGREAALRGHAWWTLGIWLLLLLGALVVGQAFASRALAPVVAMAKEVEGMQAKHLDLRLATHDPPRDELEALAATFNGLLARLEAAFLARRRFVADASHELKSPLTGIRGTLDLIRRRGEGRPEQVQAWASAAILEADRLGRLVGELLVLAQSDETGIPLQREVIELEPKLRAMAEGYGLDAQGKARVGLELKGQPKVWGDRDRLRQVLTNLIDNALRATQQRGRVWLEAEASPDGGWVQLSVVDEGQGIPAEDLERIFDRFTRLDAGRARGEGGHGLGLSIVNSLVRAHGGRIEVKSQVGQGSRFTVTLPSA